MKDVMAGLQQTNSEKILLSWVRQNTRQYPQVSSLAQLYVWFTTAVLSSVSGNDFLINVNVEKRQYVCLHLKTLASNVANDELTSFLHFVPPVFFPFFFFFDVACLHACLDISSEQISMNFQGQLGFVPGSNGLAIGGDLDVELAPSDDYLL